MTPSQRGYYINLLAHAWLAEKPGTLPNDVDVLWRLAGAKTRKDFERESNLVLGQFKKARGGDVLFNERMCAERQAQKRRIERMRVQGIDAANKRWGNKIDGNGIPKNSSASAFAVASASASANQSQSQKPPANGAGAPPRRSEYEQRRIVEARDERLRKEEEVRKEIHVGAGPELSGAIRELAKRKAF